MNLRNLVVTISICLGLAGVSSAQPLPGIPASGTSAGVFTPIRVHGGGGAYTDSQGQTWSADTDFSGGSVFSTTSSIRNTPDSGLYQTERYGPFSYQFTVPNGNYNVVLKFAELYWTAAGKRIFSVSIDGTEVLTNFDVVAAAGAPLTAIDKTFPVTVTSGTVKIQFLPGSVNQPKVSAIQITQSPTVATRVHGGGGVYTDSQGQTWSADTDFSGGSVFSTTNSIRNTPDSRLYQTERYGPFSYQLTVPNGNYNVVLKFAELYWTAAGKRIFNVSIDGAQVLTNFDIVAAAGAPLTAVDKTFPVTVTNGTVKIQFLPGSVDQPKVSAIQITQSPAVATRVHGGGGAYTDSQGQTWSADTGFSGGSVFSTTSSIRNTPDSGLYQTERYGSFSYQLTVPNGNYNVVLKFAELYWTAAGKRIFNVSIDGAQMLTNFDIVAAAGAPLTAVDKTFPVTVTNGTVKIQFLPGSVDQPKVSAIQIVQTSAGSLPTPQGQLSLSPTNFAFGKVNIGTTTSQIFSLSNTGTATTTLSGTGVSGPGFNATGVSRGVVLNPGQSTTLTVTFTPAAAGPVTGGVTFSSDATNATAAIVLSGTGVQVAAHSVLLTWNASASRTVIGYYVYRGATSAGPFALMTASTVSAALYTDTTVESGQAYYYVVRSADASHTQSANSNEVSVIIP